MTTKAMSHKMLFKYTAQFATISGQLKLANCFTRAVNQGTRHNKALPEEGRELT
jgi:hypothetical protein